MAGAPLAPASLDQAVLVIIDAQREYLDGALPLDGIEPAMARIADLLAKARRLGTPIVHVAHKGRPGGLFDRDGEGGSFLEPAVPQDGETVIEKSLPNAFAGTGLHDFIAATGRRGLILAGFQTHMCVSATARAALDLGYLPTVVADAAATRDLPDPVSKQTLPARTVHATALAELADRFAIVAPAAAIA